MIVKVMPQPGRLSSLTLFDGKYGEVVGESNQAWIRVKFPSGQSVEFRRMELQMYAETEMDIHAGMQWPAKSEVGPC